MMVKLLRVVAQIACYTIAAVGLGYFSTLPAYQYLPENHALIKLSFSHAADHIRECRRLSQEELSKLAPNMRKPTDCPRARLPLYVELHLNDKLYYQATVNAAGLASDGPARIYQTFKVPAGDYLIQIKMRDSAREQGFDYSANQQVSITAGEGLVIDFREETGGFKFL